MFFTEICADNMLKKTIPNSQAANFDGAVFSPGCTFLGLPQKNKSQRAKFDSLAKDFLENTSCWSEKIYEVFKAIEKNA